MTKTMLEVGWSFMFYLEGWSSRSIYFIGVALFCVANSLVNKCQPMKSYISKRQLQALPTKI